jgi:zinc transport system substrate-binding protein
MRRISRFAGVTLVCALALPGCGADSAQGEGGRPAVVAAFYPLAWAAERVGGEFISVENLTSSGVEPHDLELSVDQIRNLSEADLVVYVGEGFQPAVEDALSGSDDSRRLDVLGARGLETLEGEGQKADPHVWLDPVNMQAIVDALTRRLTELDPGNRPTYEANAEQVNSQLAALAEDFDESLSGCNSRDIVTSHDAFGYLAARYDLNQIGISGIDPEAEPSPARLAEVARFVQENDVSTIFFEELVSPEVAETIASETGARTAMLSPLESEPESGDYVSAMESNLAGLTEPLDRG